MTAKKHLGTGPTWALNRILPIVGLLFVSFIRVSIFGGKSHVLLLSSITKTSKSWVDFDCFQPLPHPILGEYKNWNKNESTVKSLNAPHIVNVGFPKCGSTSLFEFLLTANISYPKKSSHMWPCGKGPCGQCIRKAVNNSLPPLQSCGNSASFTQIDQTPFSGTGCIWPQISYLKEIYEGAPETIFLLPFRNVTDWIKSATFYHGLKRRMWNLCVFPEYNLTKGWGSDKDMEDLYCRHVKHVRHFVSQRPSLTLVEYSISDKGVGDFLASQLPHMNLNGSKYGHRNPTRKVKPNKTIESK
mmetsp:Transcript_8990/g.15633  ORF Transcript_8990/g.15633 Transcript_8990/m.15633 type:complete len:300 (-) Transcript_8990:146-1045(-)